MNVPFVITLILFIILLLSKPRKNPMNLQLLGKTYLETYKYGLYPKKAYTINIPMLYINMDKNPDRREFMEQQFKKYNLKAERVRGVNGSLLNSIYAGITEDGYNFTNHYSKMTKGEVGCTLAHLKAIKIAHDRGYKLVLILEDDCCFDLIPLWDRSLEDVMEQAPKDWEILQLYGFKCLFDPRGLYIPNDKNNHCWSAVAYILNTSGMDKVMQVYDRETKTFNLGGYGEENQRAGIADGLIYDKANTYVYTIPMLYAYNDKFESTLHNSHQRMTTKYSSGVVENYFSLNQFTVPLSSKQQVNMARALTEMDSELQNLGVSFFLTAGTLLGFVREGKFIEGTGDNDLGCFASDILSKVNFTFPKRMGNFVKTNEHGTFETGYECSYKHIPTKVMTDIHLFYEMDNGKEMWSITFNGICKNSSYDQMCRWKTASFDVMPVEFLNRTFYIPSNSEQILEDRYGINWNIPVKYGYFEGLNDGHYRGLITDDFKNKKLIKQLTNGNGKAGETKKLFDWYPSKIKSSGTVVWIWNNDTNLYKEIKNENFAIPILMNEKTFLYLARNNKSDTKPTLLYMSNCIVAEYGGVCVVGNISVQDIKLLVQYLNTKNYIYTSSNFAGNPYNKVCMYIKHLCEKGKTGADFNKALANYKSRLIKVYPNEYMKL